MAEHRAHQATQDRNRPPPGEPISAPRAGAAMTLISPRPRPGKPPLDGGDRCRHSVHLRLTGDIDLVAASGFTRTLEAIDRMPAMILHVDMGDVTFFDSSGMRPLVEAARRRRRLRPSTTTDRPGRQPRQAAPGGLGARRGPSARHQRLGSAGNGLVVAQPGADQ